MKDHGHEGTIEEMAERIRKEFGIVIEYPAMKSFFSNHKIHAAPRKGRKRPEKRITTPEMDAFILEHYKGTGHKAMADLVNERFGTSFTKEQIKAYYARNKLDSGLTGRFDKGHEPWTKGKHWAEYMPADLLRARTHPGQPSPGGIHPEDKRRLSDQEGEGAGLPVGEMETTAPACLGRKQRAHT